MEYVKNVQIIARNVIGEIQKMISVVQNAKIILFILLNIIILSEKMKDV